MRPRKGPLHRAVFRRQHLASMGPRSCDRGKACFWSMRRTTRTELQWGRGHATAERATNQAGDWAPCSLQWGRGHATAERARHPCSPRHPHYCFNGAAVMRPRKARQVRLSVGITPKLQWGRGHATAERNFGVVKEGVAGMLQWGRGHATAERIAAANPTSAANAGFNGAAVMRPRKVIAPNYILII